MCIFLYLIFYLIFILNYCKLSIYLSRLISLSRERECVERRKSWERKWWECETNCPQQKGGFQREWMEKILGRGLQGRDENLVKNGLCVCLDGSWDRFVEFLDTCSVTSTAEWFPFWHEQRGPGLRGRGLMDRVRDGWLGVTCGEWCSNIMCLSEYHCGQPLLSTWSLLQSHCFGAL